MDNDYKKCNHCLYILQFNEFGKNIHFVDGLQPTCKSCRNAQNIKYSKKEIAKFKKLNQVDLDTKTTKRLIISKVMNI